MNSCIYCLFILVSTNAHLCYLLGSIRFFFSTRDIYRLFSYFKIQNLACKIVFTFNYFWGFSAAILYFPAFTFTCPFTTINDSLLLICWNSADFEWLYYWYCYCWLCLLSFALTFNCYSLSISFSIMGLFMHSFYERSLFLINSNFIYPLVFTTQITIVDYWPFINRQT